MKTYPVVEITFSPTGGIKKLQTRSAAIWEILQIP